MKPLFALLAALVLALGGCSAGEAPGSAGDAAGEDRPDWAVAGKIALAWALTFPGCMAIGYWMARVFLSL